MLIGFFFILLFQVQCQDKDNVCKNNATCYVNSGRVLCKCPPGYEGAYCEILIDNCEDVPCLHGATCNNMVNNYTCSCTIYYEGNNCENGEI